MIETMLPKSISEEQKGFKLLELWAVDKEPRRGWLKYYEEPLPTAQASVSTKEKNRQKQSINLLSFEYQWSNHFLVARSYTIYTLILI